MDENIERLKHILLNETPILFVGAGFALSASTKIGKTIPTGGDLKKIIIENFLKYKPSQPQYNELISYSLSQVCQYCANVQSKEYLTDFLTDFFSNITPSSLHLKLTDYFWKRIYTTNIDDLIENIFKQNQKELIVQQYVRKFTFKKDNATEYFKLHGSVNNPSEGFTFSTDDYVDTMIQSRDYRFSSLSSDMHSEHFVFLGSSFEEINLDFYFKMYENTGYASSRGKIFLINPSPSLLLRSKVEKIQAILIEWDTEKFFEFIEIIKKEKRSIESYNVVNDVKKIGFYAVKQIREKILAASSNDSQLYLGYEPAWSDIFNDWDFRNVQLEEVFAKFLIESKSLKTSIFSIYGKPYIGKSTYLKRIGNELRNSGYETYFFAGKNFNYSPFLQLIKRSDALDFAILVDNASYYYGSLKALIRNFPSNKRLIVVTAARPFFHFRWRYNFVGENFFEYLLEPIIDLVYAEEVIDKLNEKGFLGQLKSLKTKKERMNKIMSHNDIMSFLFSITYGKGFVSRLNKDLQPFLEIDDLTKDLLIALAIFNKLELPHFPPELISHFTNNKSKEYLKKIEGFVKTTFDGNIQLRSGFFTMNIIKSVFPSKVISHLDEILIRISAQVDENGHSYWNEIHATLIKEKTLRKVLKLKSQQIRQLLYNLRNYYSENFNFWIQLGIVEQKEKDFEKALNHFRQAEALRPNSYMVQNAIGRNFLKQANSLDSISIAKKYFIEGEKMLVNLIENREEVQARAFSTHTYLYEKMIFTQKFGVSLKKEEIKSMMDYLKRITDKDPNDVLAKHIGNLFMKFLKKINKSHLIKIHMQDLSKIKALFTDYDLNLDEMLDDIEID